MIYMFFLKICWVRKRSLILILSSYLVMIFACFWKALCIWEFGIDNKIVLCVRNGSSCIHVYTTPFLFRIDLLLHVCTSSVFRKFFALFYFLRLEKAGKKNPFLWWRERERDVYSNICTLIVFKNRTCCLCDWSTSFCLRQCRRWPKTQIAYHIVCCSINLLLCVWSTKAFKCWSEGLLTHYQSLEIINHHLIVKLRTLDKTSLALCRQKKEWTNNVVEFSFISKWST